MFKDEVAKKLAIKDEIIPFALNMLGRGKIVVSGVKRIISASDSLIVLKIGGENVRLIGENLSIVEIGGGDLYAVGKIKEISFEKEK